MSGAIKINSIHNVKRRAMMDTRISRDMATVRTPSTAGKPVTAGSLATACSKGTAETPTTPLGYTMQERQQ
jgi:hypothetical protein